MFLSKFSILFKTILEYALKEYNRKGSNNVV